MEDRNELPLSGWARIGRDEEVGTLRHIQHGVSIDHLAFPNETPYTSG